jgi:hypothetical protein
VFPILDGKAVVELAEARGAENGEPSGRGFSIRYYDPAREKWIMAQHWPNPNFDGIAFTDQLIGGERHGRLAVYSVNTRPSPDGTRVHRRYQFSDIAEDRFRWDGANTSDEGATWTTWRVVEFHRTGPQPALPPAGEPLPGVHAEQICTDPPHHAMNGLEGVWEGVVETDAGAEPARMTAGRFLDGCAVAAVLERPESGDKLFRSWSYSNTLGVWVALELGDAPEDTHAYRISAEAGPGAAFLEAPDLAIKDERTPLMSREAFDTSGALRRTVWRTIEEDVIAFDEEVRTSPNDDWTLAGRFRLEREND